MYLKISDYGIIGNLRTIGLIGLNGSIDWLCLPHLDSPSVFGALLDDRKGGSFALQPSEAYDSMAVYISGTNVLQTNFRTRSGMMELTDFMTVPAACEEECETEGTQLFRRVRVMRGAMDVTMHFDPRFDYAQAQTSLVRQGHRIVSRAGAENMVLVASRDIPVGNGEHTACWSLKAGEVLWFRLMYEGTEGIGCDENAMETALAETVMFWRDWLHTRETGKCVNLGHYQPMLDRSALVLKLLQFKDTGTIAAAATTSLPEEIGGCRNWDYRYTWVRDTSFTLQALFNLGHLSETEDYLKWIERLLAQEGADKIQIMYGLRGEKQLPEKELDHLDGYKGSKPVRIGNAAVQQHQLDIYGELMDAALHLSHYAGKIDHRMWPALRSICNHVVQCWAEKDSGIWEVRGGPYNFVYSKVMCWVALDRGITIARRYGFPADLQQWERTARVIKKEVIQRGWSDPRGAFVQHYDADVLDASNLLLPLLGFLPFEDWRIVSTIETIRTELEHGGFLYRYLSDDGLPGNEGAFLLCSFWLVDCLVGLGRMEDAELLLRKLEGTANHLGLFSEEYDDQWQEALGNFPQAFTHVGYINSVIRLLEAKRSLRKDEPRQRPLPWWRRMLPLEIGLNDEEVDEKIPADRIAMRLKETMNVLRGAFFDTALSRVAYERMKGSAPYEEYMRLSLGLKNMRLEDLEKRHEKIAFWINLYNVLVIHAVIELGVRDSVKELVGFFKRVSYRIGGMTFTPHQIEHGILRGNLRPPHSFVRVFSDSDPRLRHAIRPMDPRIHFALVCASSSCPPIDVYTGENLDWELEISGRTFLNGGGVIIDREKHRVSLSRIFKWYARDFGESEADRLSFIAPYLYDEEDGRFLRENRRNLSVQYQRYDWRLNRVEKSKAS